MLGFTWAQPEAVTTTVVTAPSGSSASTQLTQLQGALSKAQTDLAKKGARRGRCCHRCCRLADAKANLKVTVGDVERAAAIERATVRPLPVAAA
jgi:hypothetical protein